MPKNTLRLDSIPLENQSPRIGEINQYGEEPVSFTEKDKMEKSTLTTEVTKDKIAIHTDAKICLVCRGDVVRFSYICECGAIYCGNCAEALTNLENVCWACDVPIDVLKPVKPFREEEKVKIGKRSKKK